MKISEQTGNGSRIMLFNSPDGSTMQWDRGSFRCNMCRPVINEKRYNTTYKIGHIDDLRKSLKIIGNLTVRYIDYSVS